MNPNYNVNQVSSGSHLLKGFFSRISVLTLTVSSAILTALIIFQTIISGYSGKKINMLSALYYLFGNNSIATVNVVFGSIVSLISILFFASFLSIYLKAKSNDDDNSSSGLSLLLFSSITYIIVTCITVTLAFASISVLRYESQTFAKQYDSREFGTYHSYSEAYTSGDANNDFFCYIAFGTFAILLGIGAVRLSLAMKKAYNGDALANRGSALFLIGSIGMVSLTCISFFVSLGNLVIPNLSDESSLDPIILLFSIINVLIFGAVSAVLFSLIFLNSHYSLIVNKTYKVPRATSYYASYATNVYPSNAARPISQTMPVQPINNAPNSYFAYNNQGAIPYPSVNPTRQVNPYYQQTVSTQPQQQVNTSYVSSENASQQANDTETETISQPISEETATVSTENTSK